MAVRTIRVRMAARAPPKVSAGKIKWTQLEGDDQVAVPETGNRPSPMAKNKISIGPSAKLGNDKPSRLTKLSKRSSQRLRRSAERTPAGMEISRATIIAAMVSSRVEGYASAMSEVTGRWKRSD